MTVSREECIWGAACKAWAVDDRRQAFLNRGIESCEQLAAYIDRVMSRPDTHYMVVERNHVNWGNEAELIAGAINPNDPAKCTAYPCRDPHRQLRAVGDRELDAGRSRPDIKAGPLPDQYEPFRQAEIQQSQPAIERQSDGDVARQELARQAMDETIAKEEAAIRERYKLAAERHASRAWDREPDR